MGATIVQLYGAMNFSCPESQNVRVKIFYLKCKLKDLILNLNWTSYKKCTLSRSLSDPVGNSRGKGQGSRKDREGKKRQNQETS